MEVMTAYCVINYPSPLTVLSTVMLYRRNAFGKIKIQKVSLVRVN